MAFSDTGGNVGVEALTVEGGRFGPTILADGLRFDLVVVPVVSCCGVFDELVGLPAAPPPIALRGDVLLFLVRPGSAANARASFAGRRMGVELFDGVDRQGMSRNAALDAVHSWLLPAPSDQRELPEARSVVAAIERAYLTTLRRKGARMLSPPNTISTQGLAFGTDDMVLMRQLLNAHGYVYVTGLVDGFDYVSQLRGLGELEKQYNGALVREVTPEPDIGNDVLSASNTRELTPHTESYEFDGVPPRYVALWCVQPTQGSGGETTLADGYQFIRQFSADDRQHMYSHLYSWRSSPSLASRGVEMLAQHPILERLPSGLVMRYSYGDVIRVQGDDFLTQFIESGRQFFEASKLAIKIERNAILVWDNWRMMHARNAFSDRNRHLRRVLISPDR